MMLSLSIESLISEMEQLLYSGKTGCDIKALTGESEHRNIDDLLSEADKLITETLPYFQSISDVDKISNSTDISSFDYNNTAQLTSLSHHNSAKKEAKNQIKEMTVRNSKTGGLSMNKSITNCEDDNISILPFNNVLTSKDSEVNETKKTTSVCSVILNCHKGLENMICENQNGVQQSDQTKETNLKEALNYYKLRYQELEEKYLNQEKKILNWEIRYQDLNYYCERVLKKEIEKKLKCYENLLNGIISRSLKRETQLSIIISNLLDEIDNLQMRYRVKLNERNIQVKAYLDQIERIFSNVYELRSYNLQR
ncbi:uncharacterized protein LOC126834969 [Adelges cooleyi]|uniref:uncharacterized protein LOC126834969 n=1 Tax=Adelges cooleyi TaxID=133065 RepID=UPI00217FE22A|nr:uncharacterized protein LOC126834969 [Adelges cooleyi]XP_050423205.1 uncharacterized protein LOC126834969 [Adelges cooleyi]